jgi:hypothetical protein
LGIETEHKDIENTVPVISRMTKLLNGD